MNFLFLFELNFYLPLFLLHGPNEVIEVLHLVHFNYDFLIDFTLGCKEKKEKEDTSFRLIFSSSSLPLG